MLLMDDLQQVHPVPWKGIDISAKLNHDIGLDGDGPVFRRGLQKGIHVLRRRRQPGDVERTVMDGMAHGVEILGTTTHPRVRLVSTPDVPEPEKLSWLVLGRGAAVMELLAGTPHVVEGYPTARSAWQLARRHNVSTPIIEQVHAVLYEGKDVKDLKPEEWQPATKAPTARILAEYAAKLGREAPGLFWLCGRALVSFGAMTRTGISPTLARIV